MPSTSARRRKVRDPRFVVAIDIGTTYSGVSYCIVGAQGEAPIFREVDRWPKQIIPNAKVPSVIYYDAYGKARLCGADTEDEANLIQAERNGWKKAEWWKLALCPEHLAAASGDTARLAVSLPLGVSADQALRDMLVYIMQSLKAFVQRAHPIGDDVWGLLCADMDVVLTTPNGWEGQQQHRMRRAAIEAGVVGRMEGRRIKFVSEGEAAVHYCMSLPAISYHVEPGNTILVCDAGGGTIDINAYRINEKSRLLMEEVSSPECLVGGGKFVTEDAIQAISEHLKGSPWDGPGYTHSISTLIEMRLKRHFTGNNNVSYLMLDPSGTSNDQYGVTNGYLVIPREDMEGYFRPSLKIITDGMQKVMARMEKPPDHVFIVGGLAESEYIFSRLKAWSAEQEFSISKPDGVMSKAIANGALAWHRHSAVQIHISKMHYGAETDMPVTPGLTDGRESFKNSTGERRVRSAWSSIVKKDVRLRVGEEHNAYFHQTFHAKEDLDVELEIYGYRGDEPPRFFKSPDGNLVKGFVHLGTIQANLKAPFDANEWLRTPKGKPYKVLEYEICLVFDEIEIKAFLKWRENKKVKTSDAVIVYDI